MDSILTSYTDGVLNIDRPDAVRTGEKGRLRSSSSSFVLI